MPEPVPVLEVDGVTRWFPGGGGLFARRPPVQAVTDVSFHVAEGEIVGIIGESGCGKSTVARLIVGLDGVDRGEIRLDGRVVNAGRAGPRTKPRREAQLIFQDPYASLNPRLTVGTALGEPLANHRGAARAAIPGLVEALLHAVGMPAAAAARFPHEFSGGQRQRIGIARALAAEPRVIVADEAVSALDVSVQAQIVALFAELRRTRDLSIVFVSHDLAVVEHLSDRILVMYVGQVVESAPAGELLAAPRHPYTQLLVASTPHPDPDGPPIAAVPGELPSPRNPPPGCRFASRCPAVMDLCRTVNPALTAAGPGRTVRCHLNAGAPTVARA